MSLRLRYHVEHCPDGGEPFEHARFACKGDAIAYVQSRVTAPGANIRELSVWEGSPNGKRSRLVCRGGWVVELDRPGTVFVVLS